MTLQELLTQRFHNTVYVHPNANKIFTPLNKKVYDKALDIFKVLYDLYAKYPIKLLNELHVGLSYFMLVDKKIDIKKELNGVEELEPFFTDIFQKSKELYDLICNDEVILQKQNISIQDFNKFVLRENSGFIYKLYMRLGQIQDNKYIPFHYNILIVSEFNTYYKVFEEYLYAEYHFFKIFVEFQNLDLPRGQEIILNHRFKIKWLDEFEWHNFINREINSQLQRYTGNIENPVLEVSLRAKKINNYNMNIDSECEDSTFHHSDKLLDKFIYDVLTVLRLYSENYIGFQKVFSRPPNLYSVYFEHFLSYLYSNTLTRTNSKYQLSISQELGLSKLFKKYELSKKEKALSLAIRRFNSTYERNENEDKLIDYFIALEALYHIDGNRKHVELSKKISEDLGKDDVDKRTIRKNITKYYGLRNSIIHDPNIDRKTIILESVEYLNYILRSLILKFLNE